MTFYIEHCSIRCQDLEASIDFYRRMFDAEVVLRRNLPGSKRIVYLRIGENMLELMEMGPALPAVDPREHYGVHHIGIRVDDFESAYRKLKEKGADFLGEPIEAPGSRLAFLREPNGAVIELVYRDPKLFREAMEKGTMDW